MSDEEVPEVAGVFLPPEQLGGVYANWAQVSHSEHEFTIDFVRMEYAAQPVRGVVVSRVSVSPLFVTQLIDALQANWLTYASKAMPQEVTSNDPNED